jgi:hypothetical protein
MVSGAMITTAHRMESLSRAYLQAVAAQAGLNYALFTYDYGIDISLREVERAGPYYVDTGRAIDIQLRSTTGVIEVDAEVRFDLDVRTYDHLRDDRAWVNRVLVLLVLPSEEARWVSQTADALTIQGRAYWLVLRGRPAVENTATVRVTIPRQNVVTPNALRQLLTVPVAGGGT